MDEEAAPEEEEEEEKLDDISDLLEENIDEEIIEDLFNKNTESFRCLAQILISRSSLLRHPLYPFPPLVDPGLDEAFNYVEPEVKPDSTGCEYYKQICKELGIFPFGRVLKSLPTEVLDLKYYGLTHKQTRAIMETLIYNEHVTEVNLQDNWFYPETIEYISTMLKENNKVECLNMRQCRIKIRGADRLNEGLPNSIILHELDLSCNHLGEQGLEKLEPALSENTSVIKLNLSHNKLEEEAAKVLARILSVNSVIEDLDLSWNGFYTAAGNKALFTALIDNKAVKILNLSWNGIETKESVGPIAKYLKKTTSLEHLDISNNSLTQRPLRMIKTGIAKCSLLLSVKIGNNLITPDEALIVLKVLNTNESIETLDMENTFVNKDFVPIWKKFLKIGKNIRIGGILSNYVIHGPDTVKLVFDRAKFLAMKAKKKKAKKDFGHFILQMPDENVTKQEFQNLVKKFKMKKVDKDLVEEIMNKFPAKKQKISLPSMKASYMSYYPDTALPPPKKKKGKKGKKGKKEATNVQEQPPAEEAAPAATEAAPAATEAQPVTEREEPAEGQSQPIQNERQLIKDNTQQQLLDGQQQTTENNESPTNDATNQKQKKTKGKGK